MTNVIEFIIMCSAILLIAQPIAWFFYTWAMKVIDCCRGD